MKNLLILTLALLTISCCKEEEEYFNISGTYELIDENQELGNGWSNTILLSDYGYPPDDIGRHAGSICLITTEGVKVAHSVFIYANYIGSSYIMRVISTVDGVRILGEIDRNGTGEIEIKVKPIGSDPSFQYNGSIKKL